MKFPLALLLQQLWVPLPPSFISFIVFFSSFTLLFSSRQEPPKVKKKKKAKVCQVLHGVNFSFLSPSPPVESPCRDLVYLSFSAVICYRSDNPLIQTWSVSHAVALCKMESYFLKILDHCVYSDHQHLLED